MIKVPIISKINPQNDFRFNFSLKIRYEKTTATTMLILSIATIILTIPFCNA